MSQRKSILMVVTSHDAIDRKHPTGLWFEEFSVPYTLFRNQGYAITVASPKGGDAPIDPRSLEEYEATVANEAARTALKGTRRLDSSLQTADFDALFFCGGHGTMFDLPDNADVQRWVAEFVRADKVLASVCHGPACLVGASLRDGTPVVKGRRVTSFTDQEERAVALDRHMPFLLESRLRELGAEFVPAANWQDNVVVDGNLITGQNPQSSASAARAVIWLLSA
ncbi:type 1 glutamine amidotransferase domain-containing protein [Nitrosococcus wardiae]|uniref:Type 1 glutamine amidotransferase domain-containing protein n=1 Tax=Nitrosococcus wardiae TaxID=1814290 RepID=A0A4P7BXX1_9GAMM|nr:type 1 glutamine amidotransferase domain-containing protein [Nitrosococcus wardiae]QBQ55028.1 type 1 glutamine amidotransferase domain-containing protein [Nitrosococcus wardiae]